MFNKKLHMRIKDLETDLALLKSDLRVASPSLRGPSSGESTTGQEYAAISYIKVVRLGQASVPNISLGTLRHVVVDLIKQIQSLEMAAPLVEARIATANLDASASHLNASLVLTRAALVMAALEDDDSIGQIGQI